MELEDLVYTVVFTGIYLLMLFVLSLLITFGTAAQPQQARTRRTRIIYTGSIIVGALAGGLLGIVGLSRATRLPTSDVTAIIPLPILYAGVGLGFLTLLGSPIAFFRRVRRFARIYYPLLVGILLIVSSAQYMAVRSAAPATHYIYCPDLSPLLHDLDVQLGETVEPISPWYFFTNSQQSQLLIPLPQPVLPLWAPARWRALQTGIIEIRLDEATFSRGPEEHCNLRITVH